jgi:hypothetical protein
MTLEPPDGYVGFVARHLEWLRGEAVRATGDQHDGDRLYPDVLRDVARWWGYLELRARLPGQGQTADRYLHRALDRHIRRWEAEGAWGRDADSWTGEIEVRLLQPAPAGPRFAGYPGVAAPFGTAWTNAATRLAPYLRPTARVDAGPVAEAAIAWWHAYQARRRRRQVAVLAAILTVIAILMRLQTSAETVGLLVPWFVARRPLAVGVLVPGSWCANVRRRVSVDW